METETAIRIIRDMKRTIAGTLAINDPAFDAARIDALDMASGALKKQIPRLADSHNDVFGRDILCPICGNQVGMKAYCAWCGQKIKYGSEVAD